MTARDAAHAHYLRGQAHQARQEPDLAIAAYRRAIELDDRFEDAWWSLLQLLQYAETDAKLEELYRAYLERFPGNAPVGNALGLIVGKEGRWDEALRCFDTALASVPDSTIGHYGKVVALLAQGRLDQAAQALDDGKARRIWLDAKRAVGLNDEGVALAKQERWAEAAVLFRAAIAAHIEFDNAHYNLGMALLNLGMVDFAPLPPQPEAFRQVRDAYHVMAYYKNQDRAWNPLGCYWQGHAIQKFPNDLATYHEIIWETRPGLIVECGTFAGGSALYYASLLDMIGSGKVVSVDLNPQPGLPRHPRITYLTGSSIDPAIQEQVRGMVKPDERVMVILDSDHSTAHVRAELNALHDLVSPGCYLVVEDTTVDLSPIANVFYQQGGPLIAVAEFIAGHPEFLIDRRRERFLTTVAPYGFLYRLASGVVGPRSGAGANFEEKNR